MAELDLSKAYEAAALGVASDAGRVNTVDRDRVVGPMCVDLALPHILDALAEQAERDGDAAYVAWQHADLGTGGPDYDAQKAAEDSYGAAAWLQGKAKDLRNV